jgi:hypothetical protein
MYSFEELFLIFKGVKTFDELEKACDALLWVIEDGDLTEGKMRYAKLQSQIKFRQLIRP